MNGNEIGDLTKKLKEAEYSDHVVEETLKWYGENSKSGMNSQ